MSEYQYYEFQAIDRPLTSKEMGELRDYSSRARITATSFVNDYSYGSFKGDEDAWMVQYFDAFLYLANWGTHVLKLRLPSRLLDPTIAGNYCGGDAAAVWAKSGKVILSFVSEDEDGDEWIEGEGHLSSLVGVRAELARGDLRALYLGWLLQAQTGELDDDDVEPPVPPGMGQLTGSLAAMAEFLRIDSDLVHVAAQGSAAMQTDDVDRGELRAWIAGLPVHEKDEILANAIVDGDRAHLAELLQRYLRQHAVAEAGPSTEPRTVGQLLGAAEDYANERMRAEAEKRAKEKARREKEAAIARAKRLDDLVGSEAKLWAKVDDLVASKQPKNYDLALRILADLRDLAARGTPDDFRLRIEALRAAHARKTTFIQRLRKAGL